jgi:hypothetical protein
MWGLGFLGRKGGRRSSVTAFFVFAPADQVFTHKIEGWIGGHCPEGMSNQQSNSRLAAYSHFVHA